jgi:biotin-(acetyl-CoA carboxylase) ligase
VVGVGINVVAPPEDFPPELLSRIIRLAEAGAVSSPAAMLPGLVKELLAATERLKEDKAALLTEWRQRDYLLGRPLEYCSQDKVIPAVGAGLAEDGRYVIIDSQQGEHRVTAGDVSPIRVSNAPL